MNDILSKVLNPIKQFWKNTSKKAKLFVVVGIAALLIAALIASVILNSKNYVVIFEDLNTTDAAEILALLQDMETDVKADGTGTIMVPAEDESRVRMALATEGYPKSGLSYYLIEQGSGMLSTDYERKQYVNMQLQERIGASIETLEGVKEAVVTITATDQNIFYLQDKEATTASVIIHMDGGNVLTANQVQGIRNLVSKSVSGLSKDNIAISDGQGNDLGGSSIDSNPEFLKIELTREIESDIKKKVFAVLEGPYDKSKIKVSVSANVNTNNLIKEETLYSPSPDGENTGVISESTKSSESSSGVQGDGGVAGSTSNSEVPTYSTASGSSESTYSGSNESTKYQVSEVKTQEEKSGAQIESISIGIAIDKNSFDPGEKESIMQLVAFAAGVSTESVSVQNFSFFEEAKEAEAAADTETKIDKKLIFIAAGAALLLIIIMIVIFTILRKKSSKKKIILQEAKDKSNSDAINELFGAVESAPIKPITPIKNERGQEIKDFAKTNPEIAAQLIRSWLKTENE